MSFLICFLRCTKVNKKNEKSMKSNQMTDKYTRTHSYIQVHSLEFGKRKKTKSFSCWQTWASLFGVKIELLKDNRYSNGEHLPSVGQRTFQNIVSVVQSAGRVEFGVNGEFDFAANSDRKDLFPEKSTKLSQILATLELQELQRCQRCQWYSGISGVSGIAV